MKRFCPILILFFSVATLAQDLPPVTEQQLENLTEENIEDDALLQQLSFFQRHPLNLNTATAEELSQLRLLTGLQIQNLLLHRAYFKRLLHLYELQAVPGFDLLTIQKLLPYIVVGEAQTVSESFVSRLKGGSRYVLSRFSRVLERPRGYAALLPTHYLGSAFHLQTRAVYQYKNLLYYGIVADKDAGERFFSGAQKGGFDFYSVHFFVRNLGKIKELALGDYALNLGQGLIQWQSMAFGKSADVVMLKRQAPVVQPYRSAGEFYFNRGAAATIQQGAWQATAFVSYKAFSGNVVPDSGGHFTAFNTSGYHRTRLEVEDRNRLTHFSAGGALSFSSNTFKLSLNAVTHRFSLPLQKRDEPYNRFALSGKTHFLASIDYSYTYANMHFFGEVASDRKMHHAMVHGALISVDPKVDLSVLYRNLAREFQSPFGNAFTESTLPGNEQGLYTGIQVRPRNGWQVSAYADFYRFPFLKYRVSSPTRGWDYLTQIIYIPDKKTEIYLRYRTETKPINGHSQPFSFPEPQQRQNLRLHFLTKINQQISVRARTELVWVRKEGEQTDEGFLTYIETTYSYSPRIKGNFRLQYFETGSYNSRIYAYESDVLYSFSIPALFGKGFRYYLNVHYQAANHLGFWVRLAQTAYRDRDSIGSGLNEIGKPHKTDFTAQMRLSF